MDPDEVADVLAGTRFDAEVLHDRDAALQRGAQGVPFVVVDDRIVLAGAVSVGAYARTFSSLSSTA